MRALLDINVLIALFDPAHVHHRIAREWLSVNIDDGWSSCPLTENGFIRIISQPAYPNRISLLDASNRLEAATETAWHAFWPDDISILDNSKVDLSRVHGFRQLTDAYLLALAVEHGGRLVTFDGRIPQNICRSARPENLVQL
jgi:toxin-antitoxin system PIN domain toxin